MGSGKPLKDFFFYSFIDVLLTYNKPCISKWTI